MLPLLIDESVNGNVVRGTLRRLTNPNILRAQEAGLRMQGDRVILEWAAADGRVVVTNDRKTMIAFARDRVASGLPMPGLLVLRPRVTIGAAIDALVLAVECSSEEDWKDQVRYWP
jgi:hypothetical protein